MDYRQYDNATGRFNTIDALSEIDPDKSPYAFARNSPVGLNDPTGFCPECEAAYDDPYGGQTFTSSGGAEYAFNEIAGEWDRTDTFNDLHEVVVINGFDGTHGSHDDRAGVDQRGDYEIDTDRLNNVANGIGIATGIKTELITIAIAQNFKTATNSFSFANLKASQQAWRTTNTLGNFGSKALAVTKGLGAVSGAVQIGLKINEINNKGVENATTRDWTDLGVNSAGLVAAVFFASNPIGWAVGAGALAYSIGTTIYDANNPQTTQP